MNKAIVTWIAQQDIGSMIVPLFLWKVLKLIQKLIFEG